MSVKQMALVWDLDLVPNKKIVLLAYADHADDEGNNVYPSLARIAHKTGYSRDQVRRISRELRDAGLMELVSDATYQRGAEYRLTLEGGSKLPPLKPRRAKGGVANDPPRVGAPVPPEPPLEPSGNTEDVVANAPTSSGEAQEARASLAPSPPTVQKAEKPGAFANRRTAEMIAEVRKRQRKVHEQTSDEKAKLGSQFAAEFKTRDVEVLERALAYRVAKAAGEIEGEYPSWCSFRTALDRVDELDWRPGVHPARQTVRERREYDKYDGRLDPEEEAEVARLMKEAGIV